MSTASAKQLTAQQVRVTETGRVELALPAHLLVLTAEQAQRKGWELRPDMMIHLNRASVVPLRGLDHFSVARLAKRVDDAAQSILFGFEDDHECHPLATAAVFTTLLVHEGLFFDVKNEAVLASLLLIEDLKHEGAEYRYNEKLLIREAKKWLTRANLSGLYVKQQALLIAP